MRVTSYDSHVDKDDRQDNARVAVPIAKMHAKMQLQRESWDALRPAHVLNSSRFLDCWDAAQLCWEAFSYVFRVEQAELS